jgi:hypothetical protein
MRWVLNVFFVLDESEQVDESEQDERTKTEIPLPHGETRSCFLRDSLETLRGTQGNDSRQFREQTPGHLVQIV